MERHFRSTMILITAGVLLLFLSTRSFAQDEETGFVKRMWRKFINKGDKTESVEKKKAVIPEPSVQVKQPVKEKEVEEAPLVTGRESEKRQVTPPSREEMLEMIERNLSVYGDEISEKIGNLVRKTDDKGDVFYRYMSETGNELDFEDLDEETMFNLLRRVLNEATFIRNERISLQLQQMRQVQSLQRIQQPPRVVMPPQVNKTYTPPPPVPSPPPPVPPPPQTAPPNTQRR